MECMFGLRTYLVRLLLLFCERGGHHPVLRDGHEYFEVLYLYCCSRRSSGDTHAGRN